MPARTMCLRNVALLPQRSQRLTDLHVRLGVRHQLATVRSGVNHADALQAAHQRLVAVREGVDQRRQPPAACLHNVAWQLHRSTTTDGTVKGPTGPQHHTSG